MSNLLEFALGLQAGDFLAKLSAAGTELRSFAGAADAMAAAFNKNGGRFAEAWSDWEKIKFREGKNHFELAQRSTEKFAGSKPPGVTAGEVRDDERSHFRPEFTSLEKMGFIMSGAKVQDPYHQRSLDLLQQIAENTKRPAPALSAPMPDNKHLWDLVDPSPFISNIV